MSKQVNNNPTVLPDLPEEAYKTPWVEEKNYKFVRKTNDPRFGDVVILKNHINGEVVLAKEKLVSSKKEATTDINQLKNRMNLNHRNMLQMLGYSTEIKKQLCSTNYLTRGFYKYPQTDMHRELINHKKNLTGFSAQELNKVLNDSLSSLNHLHGKGLYHGDIRPLHIGQERGTLSYQLLDRFSDPSPLEKVQINNLVGNKDLYMSPQLYRKLKAKKKDEVYDDFVNDYHALGLTMLVLGTQDGVQDVYGSDGEFDYDRLNHHMNNFRNKYGQDPQLCQSVESLVRNGSTNTGYNQVNVNATPQNDYFNVNNQNYVQNTPYQQQQYTYVQSTPQQHVTYVNATPHYQESYVNSTPYYNEQYVNTQPNTFTSHTTYVKSNVDTKVDENVQTRIYSSWEEYKQANPDVEIVDDGEGHYQVISKSDNRTTTVSQVHGEPQLVRTYTTDNGQVHKQYVSQTEIDVPPQQQQANVEVQKEATTHTEIVQQLQNNNQHIENDQQTASTSFHPDPNAKAPSGKYVMKEDGTVVLETEV